MKDNTPWMDVDLIQPHPQNPRNHTPEQIQKIADSIEELGWGRPIIISRDYFILAGHGAYIAATEKLNLNSVPYRMMDHVHDSPEALSYMIADNKLTDESDWNYGKLEPLMDKIDLEGFDLSLTGFEEKEVKQLSSLNPENNVDVVEDNFGPDTEIESMVQPGQIWQLGDHRLMCGDSTIKSDVDLLIKDNKFSLILTDPPYGQIAQEWDKEPDWTKLAKLYKEILQKNGQIHIFCKLPFGFRLNNAFSKYFKFWYDVIWCKPNSANFTLVDRFKPAHETVFLYVNDTKNLIKNIESIKREGEPYSVKRAQGKSEITGVQRVELTNSDGKRFPLSWIKCNSNVGGVEEGGHPTQKPLKILIDFIMYASNRNDLIYDSFGGSGSTLMACEQTNRTCYMIELDPHYCDIIIKRWEGFTSQKAVLIN